MNKNLTARFVESVKPPASGLDKYWDQSISAFGLFVYPTGRKTWNVFYRVKGRQKTKVVGALPAMSLADARDEAKEILHGASKGEDLAVKPMDTSERDFEWLASEYVEKHAKPNKRQWKADERLIKKELEPRWGKSNPKEITRQDVVAVLDGLVKRGAPIQANRVHALISKIFNWAISREILDYNPCQRAEKPTKERQRERVLASDEIKTLWKAFGKLNPHVGGILKLMLLTAQRRWEVSHMRVRDINLESGWWIIPGDFAKNGRSHRVPLTKGAVDIIKALPKPKKDKAGDATTDWVFPSPTRKGQCINNVQKAKQRVDALAALNDFVLHDLRRTASTSMAEMGVPPHVVGRVLNHAEQKVGITERVYIQYSYDKEKREALETWESKLQETLGPRGFSYGRQLEKAGQSRPK